jgi:hypothetical protein
VSSQNFSYLGFVAFVLLDVGDPDDLPDILDEIGTSSLLVYTPGIARGHLALLYIDQRRKL